MAAVEDICVFNSYHKSLKSMCIFQLHNNFAAVLLIIIILQTLDIEWKHAAVYLHCFELFLHCSAHLFNRFYRHEHSY